MGFLKWSKILLSVATTISALEIIDESSIPFVLVRFQESLVRCVIVFPWSERPTQVLCLWKSTGQVIPKPILQDFRVNNHTLQVCLRDKAYILDVMLVDAGALNIGMVNSPE